MAFGGQTKTGGLSQIHHIWVVAPRLEFVVLEGRVRNVASFQMMLVNYSICSFAGFGHRIHGALRSRILRSRGPRALPLGRHTDDRTHPHGPRRRSP